MNDGKKNNMSVYHRYLFSFFFFVLKNIRLLYLAVQFYGVFLFLLLVIHN